MVFIEAELLPTLLVVCPNCGTEVSSSAITCPNCGHQLKVPRPLTLSDQTYLQRGLFAPRKTAIYALVLAVVTYLGFPQSLKIYGFAVAIGINVTSIARGCYGTGPFSLVISAVLAFFGLGL